MGDDIFREGSIKPFYTVDEPSHTFALTGGGLSLGARFLVGELWQEILCSECGWYGKEDGEIAYVESTDDDEFGRIFKQGVCPRCEADALVWQFIGESEFHTCSFEMARMLKYSWGIP